MTFDQLQERKLTEMEARALELSIDQQRRIAGLETQLAQAEFQRDAALEGWRIVGEQLAALQWSEISGSSPVVDTDELYSALDGDVGAADKWSDFSHWTHRRPLNPPARAAESEGA